MNQPHTNHRQPANAVRKYTTVKSAAAFLVATVLAVSAIAQIAAGTTGIDATGDAASEMAACKNGSTQQSRETCMTEVRNANAAKRAGKVDNAGGQFKANALMRCNALKGEDKVACEARVAGLGTASGSVAGGGVVTQIESVVVPASKETITIQPQTKGDNIILIPAAK